MHVRNDIRQYDELANAWWDPNGAFASLHWIARARAALIPAVSRRGVLVDIGCGAGLLAPHIQARNYEHIGVDLTESALLQAEEHGVMAVRGDVTALPLADACADVVSAGEILEHVEDLSAAIAESCRVLKPGGLLVLDTLADTIVSKFVAIQLAERIPGGAPPGIHDPRLLVNRKRLVHEYREHGVELTLRGLRPSVRPWQARWRERGRMVPTRSTLVLFQGGGRKGV